MSDQLSGYSSVRAIILIRCFNLQREACASPSDDRSQSKLSHAITFINSMSQNPHDRTIVQPYLGFDCTQLSPTEAYGLLNHLVAPRPIAFVSTISADGLPNLAPFSFFMAGGLNPPSVAFSPPPTATDSSKIRSKIFKPLVSLQLMSSAQECRSG